jgi:uncharacterized Zn finger protein
MLNSTSPTSTSTHRDFAAIAQPWWVERWLELLDSYRFKKRLERARIYAREGNVLSTEFKGSKVMARVQGSEPEPYRVSLSLDLFSDKDWDYILDLLSQQAIYSAQLLAGDMPATIEGVFTKSGLSLFPFSLSDVRSHCSCPDKANPCKHIGAVYYQLADYFREDPFVIFQLRGRTQTQLLEALRLRRGYKKNKAAKKHAVQGNTTVKTDSVKTYSVKTDSTGMLQNFWNYVEALDPSLVVIVPPVDGKTLLDTLDSIPLAQDEAQAVQHYLQQVYKKVGQQAMMAALVGNNSNDEQK